MSRYSIITNAFDRTKADSDQQGVVPRLRDKWMRGSAWVRALNTLVYVHHTQEVHVGEFNKAITGAACTEQIRVRLIYSTTCN